MAISQAAHQPKVKQDEPLRGRPAGLDRSAASWNKFLSLFVLVVGVIGSLAFGYRMAKQPGVYWSQVQVRFISPQLDASNGLQYTPSSMIILAGAVGKMVDSSVAPRLASAEATLVGEGVRNGYSVRLPNTGGQWANQFISPYLDVQVVSTSASEVQSRTSEIETQIAADLLKLQDDSAVQSRYRISTQVSPPGEPPLYYQKGSSSRAGLAATLLGLAFTFAARRLIRRRSPPRRSPSRPARRALTPALG